MSDLQVWGVSTPHIVGAWENRAIWVANTGLNDANRWPPTPPPPRRSEPQGQTRVQTCEPTGKLELVHVLAVAEVEGQLSPADLQRGVGRR